MPWKRVSGHGKANDGFDKFDMNQWDETYWTHVRTVMHLLEKHGAYVQVMLFDRCGMSRAGGDRKNRWYLNPYNPDNHINDIPDLPSGNTDGRTNSAMYDLSNKKLMHYQESYVERLIRELAGFRSTLFETCNEYCDESFEVGPRDWERHWTRFVKARCANIVSANNLGRSTDPPGTPERYWVNDDLDMVNWHTIMPAEAYDRFVRFYDKGKAMCHGEQAYNWLGNTDRPQTTTALDLRMAAWGAFLGGGHLSWDEAAAENETDPDRATRSVMQFIQDTQFDFVHARPRPDLVDRGWCMAREGSECAVYLAEGGQVRLDLSGMDDAAFEWYRPAELDYPARGKAECRRGVEFAAPFEGDAVVHITRTV